MTSAAQRAAWREAALRYRQAHPERHRTSSRASMQKLRDSRPEQAEERARAYRTANSGLYASASAQRRAMERNSPGTFTSQDWEDLLVEFDHRCAYCQADDTPLEREHMTPLSRGGVHSASNIVPACPSCNRRKGTLTAFEFLGRGLTPTSS